MLTWLEPVDAVRPAHRLRVAKLAGGTWSTPTTIAEGPTIVANWADIPSVARQDNGTLVAHWAEKSAVPARHGYDVVLARSTDGGATWRRLGFPYRDGTETEHGFVSLIPDGDAILAFWLDGRATAKGEGCDRASTGSRSATAWASRSLPPRPASPRSGHRRFRTGSRRWQTRSCRSGTTGKTRRTSRSAWSPRACSRAGSSSRARGSTGGSPMRNVTIIVFVRARRRGGAYGRGAVATLVVATIASAAALAWTGLAGGRVNHPELQQPGDLDDGPRARALNRTLRSR